ncbi:MAG: pitrilysin family protein [Bacteroidota bacterium]
MEFRFKELTNGIRSVHLPIKDHKVSHLGLTIKAGSRNELEKEQGLAHLIEHLLFKGTSKRKAFHILNRMDSVGAELNAYTTKEETVIYASFLNEHFERAAEIIADIAFDSTFPEKEILKEKEVILDEILSYQDNPAELIFDDFEELMYPNHPLGRNILGTADSLRQLNRNDLTNFTQREYQTGKMVVSLVGDLKESKISRILEKYFGSYQSSDIQVSPEKSPRSVKFRKEAEMETFQAHLIIGSESYSVHDSLRLPMILLNNLLGGPAMNSRLSMNIREKYGIAYNLESSYTPYSDCGVFTTYLGTDKRWLNKSEKLILKELKNLRENKLTTTALHRAKQQLKGQYALAKESGVGMMHSIGKNLLTLNKVEGADIIFDKIENINAGEVLEAANYSFAQENLSTLIYK